MFYIQIISSVFLIKDKRIWIMSVISMLFLYLNTIIFKFPVTSGSLHVCVTPI